MTGKCSDNHFKMYRHNALKDSVLHHEQITRTLFHFDWHLPLEIGVITDILPCRLDIRAEKILSKCESKR